MTKVQKEASKYKDVSEKELRKAIKSYKSLSRSNSDIYNFLYTFIILLVGTLIVSDFTILNLGLVISVHYLFFWVYLHKYKKLKLVSDEDRKEIDQIIEILEGYLKERQTKNPTK